MFLKPWDRSLRALRMWRAELLVFSAVAIIVAAGAFTGFQNKLNDLSFAMTERAASDGIVIIQIDSKSLSAIETWPWPRSRHAEVIERLTASGAELIALDIDFSSPSRASEDEHLAQAITTAAGRVVLPSFVQHATPGAGQALVETNPLPALRQGALIGNANVFAPGGVARHASLGLYLPDGRYRPTFAGLVGQRGHGFVNEFAIDFAIDPASFKRLSFVDVLRADFDASAVRGRRVIIGATAVELGDRVPVPRYGVIAGVELQALIAESVLTDRMLLPIGPVGALLLAALVIAVLRPSRACWSLRFGGRVAANAAILLAGPVALLAVAPVIVESAPALAALAACFAVVGGHEFAARARSILRERSAANVRRAMIELIVQESSDGIAVVNHTGRIELCNERAGMLFNTTRTALTGRPATCYLPRFEDMTECGGGLVQGHAELSVELDGEPALLEASARRLSMPLENGTRVREARIDVYTLRDVTARRRAAEAERRALDDRLNVERAKSNFIANMSHELRTPLNAIIGFSEMIAGESLGPVNSKYAEFADMVAKSGHHLLMLINNVLEVSRIDESETKVEAFDFSEAASRCIANARRLREYKEHTIVADMSGVTTVQADERLVRHVLFNLLANAVKFSGDRGNVCVRAWSEGEAFVFEVTDDGVGIDAALMPHLTELFYQPDSSLARKHEGMGVGLYLVKRYVNMMKGALHIESEPGKGTSVRVTLPGAAQPAQAATVAA